jgi:hypothetical protein
MGIDRFALRRTKVHGLVLGFAAFDEGRIRRGIQGLAAALEPRSSVRRSEPPRPISRMV